MHKTGSDGDSMETAIILNTPTKKSGNSTSVSGEVLNCDVIYNAATEALSDNVQNKCFINKSQVNKLIFNISDRVSGASMGTESSVCFFDEKVFPEKVDRSSDQPQINLIEFS